MATSKNLDDAVREINRLQTICHAQFAELVAIEEKNKRLVELAALIADGNFNQPDVIKLARELST